MSVGTGLHLENEMSRMSEELVDDIYMSDDTFRKEFTCQKQKTKNHL